MAKSTPIKLMYDPGVTVPNLRDGQMTVSRAVRDTSGRFVINVPSIQCQERATPGEDIVNQDLPPNQVVARMSTITVQVIGYQTNRCLRIAWPYATWKAQTRINPDILGKQK